MRGFTREVGLVALAFHQARKFSHPFKSPIRHAMIFSFCKVVDGRLDGSTHMLRT
jgi:hypothetical protein